PTYALALVGAGEAHPAAWREPARIPLLRDDLVATDGELAPAGHRVARVEREVDEDLLHLGRVHAHRREVAREIELHADPGREEAGEHAVGIPHDLVEHDGLEARRLALAEGHELARERRGA